MATSERQPLLIIAGRKNDLNQRGAGAEIWVSDYEDRAAEAWLEHEVSSYKQV